MMLSLDTAYRSFGGEVEASSTPTICRLSDSRRHQLWAIARIEAVRGSLAVVTALGLFAAICNAVGLIALKPALLAGTDPLAATALRTGGGALVISVLALWPAEAFETPTKRTPSVVLRAILPGRFPGPGRQAARYSGTISKQEAGT
jgi:hypothetical protein